MDDADDVDAGEVVLWGNVADDCREAGLPVTDYKRRRRRVSPATNPSRSVMGAPGHQARRLAASPSLLRQWALHAPLPALPARCLPLLRDGPEELTRLPGKAVSPRRVVGQGLRRGASRALGRDIMTIRERIIGWLGGVGRGEYDLLTTLYEGQVREVRRRRIGIEASERGDILRRRLDAIRRAITDDDLPV